MHQCNEMKAQRRPGGAERNARRSLVTASLILGAGLDVAKGSFPTPLPPLSGGG
jgi:hypothetical protein